MEHTYNFDEATHTYRIDGRPVPSVTQVLGDLIPGWRASDWYLERGRAVHSCAALVAQGKDFESDPAIEGQVTGIRRFFAEVKPVVLAVEQQVYSTRHLYAGTFDLCANIGGKIMLVDYKASMTTSVPYQLAAYSTALPHPVRWGVGVEIRDDETYSMTEVYDLDKFRSGWLTLLGAYGIRRRLKIKQEGMTE